MNLDFGILWIEDSFSQEEEESLKRRVREAGFIARIKNIVNSKGIEELAHAHSLYHYYDIILLDYKLEDEDGDIIAPKIRELFPSTTILFYSGSMKEDDLRHMMAVKQVEGVYCSARTRFIERTGSLIEQTARSLDRLSGMRGLAMRVVAECDEIMKETVISISQRDPNTPKNLSELDKDVLEFINQMRNNYESSLREGIEGRLNSRAVDSAKLFNHFRRLTKVVTGSPDSFGLNAVQVDRLRELRANTSQYTNNVLKRRNILGHVVEVQGANGWVLTGSNEINVTDFPDIRRLFAANIDALREMNNILVHQKK
jgi:DNA-binding NarL/FixJ family response regulator